MSETAAPMVRPTNPWALPDGQLVLPASAQREQWLEQRRKGLGSSDAPLLMGVGYEGDSEYKLWASKTGRLADEPQTEAMRRGTWLEPHVVDYFAEQTGLEVRRCGLVARKDNPILLATPDRLTEDGGIVEIKTLGPFSKTGSEWKAGIARHAYVQGQWQLMVTGRTRLWFAAYAIDQEPMIRGPVDRDEPLIERMVKRAQFWWDSFIVTDTPPPVDLATITDDEIALRWPDAEKGSTTQAEYPSYVRQMLAERAELKAAEKAAKQRAEEIDRALKVMAADHEAILIGDRPVVTFKKRRTAARVDPELETVLPEVWDRFVKQGYSRYIHVCRGWENAS